MTNALGGYTAVFTVDPGRLIVRASTQHNSPLGVFAEFGDNLSDAGATEGTFYISQEPTRETMLIRDNGKGMFPEVLLSDSEQYEAFKRKRQAAQGVEDIRHTLNPLSLGTLRWLIENFGRSSKMPRPGETISGARALGIASAYMLARRMVIYTRPHPATARVYYTAQAEYLEIQLKSGKLTPEEAFSAQQQAELYRRYVLRPELIPVYRATAPTYEDLEDNKLGFTVEILDPPYRPFRGQELVHGTVIELTSLKLENLRSFNIGDLVEMLSIRYADKIRAQALRLTVINRWTKEALRTRGGIDLLVPTLSYQGIPAVEGHHSLRGGKYPFTAEIFVSSTPQRKLGLNLKRRGVVLPTPISALKEFNRPPYTDPRVNGFISFPDEQPGDEDFWDQGKGFPREGSVRNQWGKKIEEDFEAAITAALDSLDQRSKNRKLQGLEADASAALNQVVRELMPDFSILAPVPPTTNPPRTSTKNPPTTVRAIVLDEWGEFVPDVQIELTPRSRQSPSETRWTGLSGSVSFGRQAFGIYRIRMILQDGQNPYLNSKTEETVKLDKERQGYTVQFRLQTGANKPERKKPQAVEMRLVIAVLDDEGQPYDDTRLAEFGNLVINQEHLIFRAAQDAGDNEKATRFIGDCVAHALSQLRYPNDPELAKRHWFTVKDTYHERLTGIRGSK